MFTGHDGPRRWQTHSLSVLQHTSCSMPRHFTHKVMAYASHDSTVKWLAAMGVRFMGAHMYATLFMMAKGCMALATKVRGMKWNGCDGAVART